LNVAGEAVPTQLHFVSADVPFWFDS
jgi:hypothetical protein